MRKSYLMIIDSVPYVPSLERTVPLDRQNSLSFKDRHVRNFLLFLERLLRIRIVINAREVFLGRSDLYEQSRLATRLLNAGVLKSVRRVPVWPDEPKFISWVCELEPSGDTAGGASFDNEKQAIAAALSEGLERQIWYTQTDYFKDPIKVTEGVISKKGVYIAPASFVGFSVEQRAGSPELLMSPNDIYLWIKAQSLTTNVETYIPAQVVTPAVSPRKNKEPIIRSQITTGLATWSTVMGARLSGMLEVIERDAYMIMWLNQLVLPQIDVDLLAATSPLSLKKLIADCKKYRLKLSVVQLITDAPTHAVAAVLEDESGTAPRRILGLSAHRSLTHAVEHALIEALRARRIYRRYIDAGGVWDMNTLKSEIGHIERLYYWGVPEHAQYLQFLTQGKVIPPPLDAPWEKDTSDEHYERLLQWCQQNDYRCVSVSLGASKLNITDFKVEMVIMPDLFPTYLHERRQLLGGEKRLQGIPKKFGYTPLSKPFTKRPHPFC